MQGIELAMLFCHAGFSVKTILLDGADEQISSELLKEITGHAPWSNLHKPNWVKAEIKYSVGVIFDGKIPLNPPLRLADILSLACIPPSLAVITKGVEDSDSKNNVNNNWIATPSARNDEYDKVIATAHSEPRNGGSFAEYINDHCEFLKILVDKESSLNHNSDDVKKQIIDLPDNPLNLRRLFEKILSETVALTAAKAFDGRITYSFEGDFSKIDYVKDLVRTFAEAGVETNSGIATVPTAYGSQPLQPPHCSAMQPPQSRSARQLPQSSIGGASDDVSKLIISNGKKEIEVVLEANETAIEPTKNRIYVSRHKNGLLLIDSIETRLLPDFSCHSCYSRLVNYIKVELTRLDY